MISRSLTLPILIALLFISAIYASEAPLVGGDGESKPEKAVRIVQPMQRGGPTFEVEVLTVRSEDAVSVAYWAELAAQGFRVVAAIPLPDGGGTELYVERMAGQQINGPRVPKVVSENPAVDADLHARWHALNTERQRSNTQQRVSKDVKTSATEPNK